MLHTWMHDFREQGLGPSAQEYCTQIVSLF